MIEFEENAEVIDLPVVDLGVVEPETGKWITTSEAISDRLR